jgi:phosphoglycolate phosphatase-like HAD superfamily hydrolase
MAADLIIWDCDGCLVDSEALLKNAEVEALHAAGFLQVTRDDCNRLFSGYLGWDKGWDGCEVRLSVCPVFVPCPVCVPAPPGVFLPVCVIRVSV